MDLDYTIKYSNRKTLSIIVERDRSVVIRAPFNVSEEQIKALVEKKRHSILLKVNHDQKYPVPKLVKEYVSGESLLYQGISYKLDFEKEIFTEVRFDNGFTISSSQKANAKELLHSWFKKEAKLKLVPRIKHFAGRLGVHYAKISITEMNMQWGSCSPKNNLNFNWRIIKAPVFVIDYIIVHELAHIIELNHTPAFWNIVSVQIPGYKKAKTWLKENGIRLETD